MNDSPILDLDRWPTIHRKIPYGRVKNGYKVNTENPLELIPDVDQIKWLEEGFNYLDAGSSLREVCEWLSQKLKKSLTHQTVSNLYTQHRKPHLEKRTKKRTAKKRLRSSVELGLAKREATNALKRANALEKKQRARKGRLEPTDYDTPVVSQKTTKTIVFDDAPASVNIVFEPNPGPQTSFLSATEFEVLYGGAAGGGKSYAMLADPLRFFDNPNFVGLLLRRTNDELRELKRESQRLYPLAYPGAEWREKDSMWKFPSGAQFWMSYLDREDDVMRYIGQSFCWIGVDELTQYPTPYAWNILKSRLRSTDKKLQPYLRMRGTTNPGGPGHQWVKKMFVDPAPPGHSFDAIDIETGDILTYPKTDPRHGIPLYKRRFIPARLIDNPHLYNDGTYEKNLFGLPEDQRRKLLDGDWSVVEGAAFPEFRTAIHVIEPYDIPSSWRKFRCGDYGYSDAAAVLWIAIEPTYGQLVVYRELYTKRKTGKDLAHIIKRLEQNERLSYGIIDSNVWRATGQIGPSVADEMIAEGVRWIKADKSKGSRSAGKNRLHELLKVDLDTDRPGIVFFNTCRQIISDLPSIPTHPDGEDDIDDRFRNDHTYDALRYGIMSRPKPFSNEFDNGNTYIPSDRRFGY